MAKSKNMTPLRAVKDRIADHLEYRSIKRYRSRLGWRDAPRYEHYLKACQQRVAAPVIEAARSPLIDQAVERFERTGVTWLQTDETAALARSIRSRVLEAEANGAPHWEVAAPNNLGYRAEIYREFEEVEALLKGVAGNLLTSIYRSHFKISAGRLYRSKRTQDTAAGSQLWHTDSAPGTLLKVMFYLHDIGPEHGAIELLPWAGSLSIFRTMRPDLRARLREVERRDGTPTRDERRAVSARYLGDRVENELANHVIRTAGPAGQVVIFLNNLVHRGGFPDPGHVRDVMLFSILPSDVLPPFDEYKRLGVAKKGPYPKDPAA